MADGQEHRETTTDPESLAAWIPRFLEWMLVRAYASTTVARQKEELRIFLEWCETRSVMRPEAITKPVLDAYQRHLFYLRKKDGKPLHPTTQKGRLSSVKMFFKYLSKQNVLLFNPAADMEMPKMDRSLPKHVLSAGEADAVLDQADVSTPLGIRDRAMMEMLYSTGMRRSELLSLDVFDFDLENGTVKIRKTKTKVQRVVPVGERAVLWMHRYLEDVRPMLAGSWVEDQGVFLNNVGRRMDKNGLSTLITKYVKASGTMKIGSCHMFRHTAATLMVENGADIRHVQELLGHAHLDSTAIYTRVSIKELRRVHAATHPSAKMSGSGSHDA